MNIAWQEYPYSTPSPKSRPQRLSESYSSHEKAVWKILSHCSKSSLRVSQVNKVCLFKLWNVFFPPFSLNILLLLLHSNICSRWKADLFALSSRMLSCAAGSIIGGGGVYTGSILHHWLVVKIALAFPSALQWKVDLKSTQKIKIFVVQSRLWDILGSYSQLNYIWGMSLMEVFSVVVIAPVNSKAAFKTITQILKTQQYIV